MSRNERFKRKEEKSNIRIRYQSRRGNRGSNMQGLPGQHTGGLLRCLLKGLQVEGLTHLLSLSVVDSYPQEHEIPSSVSCACMWAELPQHLQHRSQPRTEGKYPLDMSR